MESQGQRDVMAVLNFLDGESGSGHSPQVWAQCDTDDDEPVRCTTRACVAQCLLHKFLLDNQAS